MYLIIGISAVHPQIIGILMQKICISTGNRRMRGKNKIPDFFNKSGI
jgi:hypothetical protein